MSAPPHQVRAVGRASRIGLSAIAHGTAIAGGRTGSVRAVTMNAPILGEDLDLEELRASEF